MRTFNAGLSGMIQQLEVEESNRYRPDVLCPQFFVADSTNNPPWKLHDINSDLEKEYTISAVEKYALAFCGQLATAARMQHEKNSDPQLKDYVKLNLEKIAAKNFHPSFVERNNKPKSFDSLVDQTKNRVAKYSKQTLYPGIASHKQEDTCYKDRVKARLQVYKGWEFLERPDKPTEFVLKNHAQEITVTNNSATNTFTVVSTGTDEVTDETIAIMLELSHNVIRFSDTKMKMNIQGVEINNLAAKFQQGLDIINKDKIDKEQIKYTIDQPPKKQ